MTKLIFLDVDGVLNNEVWAAEMWDDYNIKVYNHNILYQPSLVQLRRIINATGATIVLSSSWRRFPVARKDLVHWLEMYDMTIDSDTPILGYRACCRGDAISAWFEQHPGTYRYIILDDENDMGEHMSHLFQTNYLYGLTEKDANMCIDYLNSEGDTVEQSKDLD